MKIFAFALVVAATLVPASVAANDIDDDVRIQHLDYTPDQRYAIQILPRIGAIIAFGRDERVKVVKLSASDSYRVAITPDGSSLWVQQIRPVNQVAMSVDTDHKHYDFDLNPSATDAAPYFVRFRYRHNPDTVDVSQDNTSEELPRTSYKLSGAKALRPFSLSDDGRRTYVIWREDQALSAIFAEDALRGEQMVDGYMRDGVFTIDRVYDRLVFRIDKAVARARRSTTRVKRDGK